MKEILLMKRRTKILVPDWLAVVVGWWRVDEDGL